VDLNLKNSMSEWRILVIEGEELLGEGLCCGLRYYNYSVDWVKDDLSAWPLLLSKRFDVIILDLDLLRTLGEDLLKNIRSKNIITPAIVMSSCDNVHDWVRGLDLGADYVSKPFDLDKLCVRIGALKNVALFVLN
jgi:DNA-binding response OmpR family regulator